jgi:hypothetical protein
MPPSSSRLGVSQVTESLRATSSSPGPPFTVATLWGSGPLITRRFPQRFYDAFPSRIFSFLLQWTIRHSKETPSQFEMQTAPLRRTSAEEDGEEWPSASAESG